MFQIEIVPDGVTATLATTNPNDSVTIYYSGDPLFIERIGGMIAESYGLYGHPIENETTPVDLYAAALKVFGEEGFKVVQGQEILNMFEPKTEEDLVN